MWPKHYADYEKDEPLIQNPVAPNQGIIGCEMHEINGWGEEHHRYRKRKGFLTKILAYLMGSEKETLSK